MSSAEVRQAVRESIAWHRQRYEAALFELAIEELWRRAGFTRLVGRTRRDAIEAAIIHECAHALARLFAPGTAFHCIEHAGDGSGQLVFLAPGTSGIGRMAPILDQLVYLVAGPAAEDVLFGNVSAGASRDLQRALLLASQTADPHDVERGAGRVRAAVAIARELVTRERVTLLALADELRARGRLTRAECVEGLRQRCGIELPEPLYGAVRPSLPDADVAAVFADCVVAVDPPSPFTQRLDADRKEAAELRARIEREVDAEMAREDEGT
jgi:hypothetical protein